MVVEKSRTISEVAKSYGLVPQTVGNWVNKWRKTHSGIEGEEMTAAQLAEYKDAYSWGVGEDESRGGLYCGF